MSDMRAQIYDIRESVILGYGWAGKDLDCVFQYPFSSIEAGESQWISGVCDHLQSCRDRLGDEVVLLLPNRVTLFKLIKIPMVRSSSEVIRHEVLQAFPHAGEELVWNAVPLVSDAIEQWYLVAAVRRQVYEALSKAVAPSKAWVVPRFSLEVAAQSKSQETLASGNTRHLINLDLDMGVHLAVATGQSVVRTLRWSSPLTEGCSHGSLAHNALMSEARRSKSFMGRQFARSQTQTFCFCGSLSERDECVEELADVFAVDGEGGVETLTVDTAVQTCAAFAFRKQRIDASRMSAWAVRDWNSAVEKQGTPGGRGLLFAACLVAVMPFPWVISHQLTIGDLKKDLRAYQDQYRFRSAGNEQLMVQSRGLEVLVAQMEQFQRLDHTHPAWLDLMAHLQTSLIEVRDLWLDDCDISLATPEQSQSVMTFSGRFLVRQRNLEQQVRPQVIRDTEHRLKLLQSKLLASPLIAETLDFKVNYEGIETGINVVMFSMKLRLTEPFSKNYERGTDA